MIRFGSEQEPLNLVDITSESEGAIKSVSDFLNSRGSFIYESRFTINEREAFMQGVTGIRFEFFASKPNASHVPMKENDFTIDIRQPPITSAPDPINIQKAIVSLKSPLMKDLALLALPMKTISLQQPLAPTPFKVAAKHSETNNKKDPAHALSTGKILGTTPKNVLNFGVQSHVPDQQSQNFDRVGAKSSDRAISLFDKRGTLRDDRKSDQNPVINSFLNLKRIIEPSSLVRTHPVVMVEVLSNNVEYTRQLAFEKTNLQGFNKIYVRVSGVVRSGVVARVESRRYVISHSSEVKDFLGNPEPPVILSSESSFGKASFILRRNDPTLRQVSVIKITKNPNLVNASFENVGIVEFGVKDTVEFHDSVDNVAPNTVIYRFVVQNEDGSSGEFVSSVLSSFTKVTDQKKVLSSTTPISIRALNTKDGIDISVDTINDQVFSLRLLRHDIGAMGEFADTVRTILDADNRYSQIVAGEKKTLGFLDRDVISGRHYRYFAAYRLGTGAEASLCQEMISDEDETIVRHVVSNRLPFMADITPAFASQDESNAVTVQFDLSVSEVEEQYNVLLDALRQAGVSQQFVTDLQNDRQKARQVAAFLVERVDRVTGRRISFGIVPPGKFVDSPESRSKLGLPDPLSGRKYEYICKLCIRPPSTFLLTATVGFTATGDSSGNITEVLAAKFQNALIGRGILPSEKQLRDGATIRENFFLGMTGLEISTVTILPQFGPKVENLTVKQRKLYNLIKWSTSGDVSNISYFLIYCNYNGTDELLGTVSSVGKNSTYQYKDTRLCNEVGQKSYFVKLVTIDHDVSIPSPKVETITDFSIPAAVLDGFILSPSRYETKGVVLPGPGPTFPVTPQAVVSLPSIAKTSAPSMQPLLSALSAIPALSSIFTQPIKLPSNFGILGKKMTSRASEVSMLPNTLPSTSANVLSNTQLTVSNPATSVAAGLKVQNIISENILGLMIKNSSVEADTQTKLRAASDQHIPVLAAQGVSVSSKVASAFSIMNNSPSIGKISFSEKMTF